MNLQWADRALGDLEDLLNFIVVDNPAAAHRLHEKVFRKADQLRSFPESGPVSKEAGAPIRELLVKPLRLLYVLDGGTVTILAVYREEANLNPDRSPGF